MRSNISGERFGSWLVVGHCGGKWECRCVCGTPRMLVRYDLTHGRSRSCGCLGGNGTASRSAPRWSSDGTPYHRLPLYAVWSGIIGRCLNPRDHSFRHYGGRGITICERWHKDFGAFQADMGPRPPGGTIDRMDNDGPYSPENCRWATHAEQCLNRRSTFRLTVGSETKTASQWVLDERCSVTANTLSRRIRCGWSDTDAVMAPALPRGAHFKQH